MKTVAEAEQIINAQTGDFGTETLPFRESIGRILAEDILADRDLPPYDRVTMDGIAIRLAEYETGVSTFRIEGTQAAGDTPIDIDGEGNCIEIMTGAAMPASFDTVVRYEDVEISNGSATILQPVPKGKHNVHYRGTDKRAGEILVNKGAIIAPAVAGIAASVGKSELLVKKLPRISIVSTGDELVDVAHTPGEWQIRRSNSYMLEAFLRKVGINPILCHVRDNPDEIRNMLEEQLSKTDVLILSGGISMGKFDHLPKILESVGVECLFHKVSQRPGKPFWFGRKKDGPVVFAFPGNPVSACLCMVRYCLPWLHKSLGGNLIPEYAVLAADIEFKPSLTLFQQVRLHQETDTILWATPNTGNGSGDFANLADSDAFIELPAEKEKFSRGEAYRIWQLN